MIEIGSIAADHFSSQAQLNASTADALRPKRRVAGEFVGAFVVGVAGVALYP